MLITQQFTPGFLLARLDTKTLWSVEDTNGID
jgi:hypothetical protein